MWLLLDAAHLTVSEEDISPARLLAPRVAGGRALAVRRGQPSLAIRFHVLAEVGRAWIGEHPRARLIADLFAAVGLLPEINAGADEDDLSAIDGEWFLAFWPDLRRLAGDVSRLRVAPGGSPERQLRLAVAARAESRYADAAALFKAAAAHAQRSEEWGTAVAALQGLSTLSLRQRDHGSARRWCKRALSTATENRVGDRVGPVFHDLFALEAHDGRDGKALECARRAMDAYDAAHPQFVPFAHDVAWYLADRGLYLRALPLLRRVAPLVVEPVSRIRVLSNSALAAGGAGAEREFDSIRAELWALLIGNEQADSVPAGYLGIAEGALHLSCWRLAAAAAKCAEEEAAVRGQADVRADAAAAREAAIGEAGFPAPAAPLSEGVIAGWSQLARAIEHSLSQLGTTVREGVA